MREVYVQRMRKFFAVKKFDFFISHVRIVIWIASCIRLLLLCNELQPIFRALLIESRREFESA